MMSFKKKKCKELRRMNMNNDKIYPPEDDGKYYEFTCICSSKKKFIVYANDYESAESALYNGDYDDYEKLEEQIEEIESVHEAYD